MGTPWVLDDVFKEIDFDLDGEIENPEGDCAPLGAAAAAARAAAAASAASAGVAAAGIGIRSA